MRSGQRSGPRLSPSLPKRHGAKLLVTSPATWTVSFPAETNSRPTSRRPSRSIHWEKYSTQCAGSVHAPAPEPSPRSATPTVSPTRPPSSLRWACPRQLAIRPHQQHPTETRRQPPPEKRYVHRRVRSQPTRPRRPRLLPTQTSPRQRTQRRRHLRRPPPPQHHLGHAQNPNPLPTTPAPTRNPRKTTQRGLTTRQGHPPPLVGLRMVGVLRSLWGGSAGGGSAGRGSCVRSCRALQTRFVCGWCMCWDVDRCTSQHIQAHIQTRPAVRGGAEYRGPRA